MMDCKHRTGTALGKAASCRPAVPGTRPDESAPLCAESEAPPCPVCPRACRPAEGEAGFCGARVRRGGQVACENYGRLTSLALDPIEKKPLAHFCPGGLILSAGSYGCNLRCPFCQNHDISQTGGCAPPGRVRAVSPQQLVDEALRLAPQGNIGIAFTYNEPGVGFEFVRDTACLAKQHDLATVMVTNGYLCEGTMRALLGCIDAFNIDLKCFTEAGYQTLGGALAPVKRSIELAAGAAHLEVTTLVVPGLSDSEDDMYAEAAWLASLSPAIPLHISRYFPRWRAQAPPTPPETLRRLAKMARTHLQHVHLGNL